MRLHTRPQHNITYRRLDLGKSRHTLGQIPDPPNLADRPISLNLGAYLGPYGFLTRNRPAWVAPTAPYALTDRFDLRHAC